MKTKITTLILSLITSISFGQITFVKETNHEIYPPINYALLNSKVNWIESGKYLITNYLHIDSLRIINILDQNLNLFKKIELPNNLGLFGLIISDHLFNDNDKIEYLYSLGGCSPEGDGCNYKMIIADEDFNTLLSIDNIKERVDYRNFFVLDGKTYLQIKTTSYTTKIYEVAGNLPCIQCNSKTSNTNTTKSPAPNYAFKIFPNPTDGQLNIESELDELNMQIKIYSTSGQLLQTDPFFYGTNSVNVSSLASGTYVINIVSDKGFLHTEKFVKR